MNRHFRTILLAEDSAPDAEMAIDALRGAKLANPVVRVEDGVEALDYLYCRGAFANRGPGNPAVVLLDIKMPRLDGWRCSSACARRNAAPRAGGDLSSSREESDLVNSWDLGVNAYVVKPVDAQQFFGAVQTLGQFWAVLNESPQG